VSKVASAKAHVLEQKERDRVVLWRLVALEAAGYEHADALQLATTLEVDLHLAIDLPRRGCPHETAVRILL
jgi:hypothetical protein